MPNLLLPTQNRLARFYDIADKFLVRNLILKYDPEGGHTLSSQKNEDARPSVRPLPLPAGAPGRVPVRVRGAAALRHLSRWFHVGR